MAVRSRSDRWPPFAWRAALVAAILAAHAVPFFAYQSGDTKRYQIPWYEHIVAAGPVHAFAAPFSNYSPPYLYLLSAASLFGRALQPLTVVKLVSCIGALWMACAVYRLIRSLGSRYALEGALASLLLPTIVLDVSLLGQADTFWVAPCILALAAGIEGRPGTVALWSGLAFAFKAQAVFLAPFVIVLFLAHRAPLRCWLIPPFVYIAAMLPAWLAGWPASNLLTVYVRQAEWQPDPPHIFISNGASWWTIYGAFFPKLALRSFWFGYLTTALAAAAYVAVLSKRRLGPNAMLAAAALSAAGMPFLLPGMHERFFLLADVLTFCLAFSEASRGTIAAALLMQIASALPGYGWAFRNLLFKLPACFFSLGAIVLLIDYLTRTPRLRRGERQATEDDSAGDSSKFAGAEARGA
jgi:Gpi18-like mannosyltransferase